MTINKCPICDSFHIYQFLKRNEVPVHQNMVFHSAESARNIQRGILTMCMCERCGFVFNSTFDPSLLKYDETYDNTQTFSFAFKDHVESIVNYLRQNHHSDKTRIVEVGCGKGHFLRKLVRDDNISTGYGFDPTYEGQLIDLNGRLNFQQTFYDEHSSEISADIVICRHVIEHVPNPLSLLRSIRAALSKSPDARVFFETPCVSWILNNQVIWDFFYEHCSIFTRDSLTMAFELGGFEVVEAKHVFGGQYLWLEAKISHFNNDKDKNEQEIDIVNLARSYAREEKMLIEKWQTKVINLSKVGNVALWGAGAKGATLAHLIDQDANLIKCIVDLNPKKQGGYLPATGHRIISYSDLSRFDIHSAILMNPNYQAENQKLLDDVASKVELLNYEK